MMSKVYIVTTGEYSDYGIVNVFSTKELAKNYVRAVYGIGEADIEEYYVDKYPKQIDKNLKHWSIEMLKNGNAGRCWVSDNYEEDDIHYHVSNLFDTEYLYVYCWAKDKQHAIKIANEKRVMIISNNLWGDGLISKSIGGKE